MERYLSKSLTDYGHNGRDLLTGANPLVQSLTHPNESITSYEYDDPLKRLTKLSNKESDLDIINEYVYGYSSAEQPDLRSSETITNGNPITSFQNELIAYDYNKVNQLLNSSPDKVFTYDDDGNMTQGYTPEGYVFSAEYDAENRLKIIAFTDGEEVDHRIEYSYTGGSLLAAIKKYEDDVLQSESRPILDGFLPLQIRGGSNGVLSEYAWGLSYGGGIGGLLDLKQGGQHYAYLYDGKGNVTALLNSGQSVAATYTYDAFGNLMSESGSLSQPFQFSTKPYDEQTGLSYFGYRFYSPVLGRWMTRDPIGYMGGLNLYGYVGNNPVNWNDPFGLDWLNDLADFSAGMGSVLSFGVTDIVNDLTGASSVVNKCSGWHSAGEWTGFGLSVAIAGAGGLEKGLAKSAKSEWSHWIPDRYKFVPGWIRDSRLNGQYMSILEHALNDPKRYQWFSAAWKAENLINPAWLSQFNRIPPWIKGAAAGAAYGGLSMTSNGRSCSCR